MKSLLGSTLADLLECPDAEGAQLADPGRRPHPQVVQTERAVRRDLDLRPDVVVVDLLEAERRDTRLVVDDLLGVAQPRSRECDFQFGAALAADRTDRAQRRRGRMAGDQQAGKATNPRGIEVILRSPASGCEFSRELRAWIESHRTLVRPSSGHRVSDDG